MNTESGSRPLRTFARATFTRCWTRFWSYLSHRWNWDRDEAGRREEAMTRKRLRTLMMWQMMRHMLIGHPGSAILSLLGFRRVCEWVHWRTLPKRARGKISQSQIDYIHDRSVFWVEVFFGPVAHLLGALNLRYLGYRIYMLGPVEAAIKHSACSGLFIRWGMCSSSTKEREEVEGLLTKVRLQRAELSTSGHLRWPHITSPPDRKWIDGNKH
jgi:hypothetical protein